MLLLKATFGRIRVQLATQLPHLDPGQRRILDDAFCFLLISMFEPMDAFFLVLWIGLFYFFSRFTHACILGFTPMVP